MNGTGDGAAFFSDRLLACLEAPGGGDDAALEEVAEGLRCRRSGQLFPHVDGVPSLVVSTPRPGKRGGERPVPDYDGVAEFGQLVHRMGKDDFARRLLDAIGYNRTVLHCGCGTGQLTHFLQLNNNHVLGIDDSLSALALAVDHKRRNRLARAAFARMDLGDLAVRDGAFDVVVAHGSLHRSADARAAFGRIVRKAKPGGIVVVGLPSAYGVMPGATRLDGESRYTIDTVLNWFEDNDLTYLNCSPAILGTTGEEIDELFAETTPGTAFERVVTQLCWIWGAPKSGGMFDVIGRRAA